MILVGWNGDGIQRHSSISFCLLYLISIGREKDFNESKDRNDFKFDSSQNIYFRDLSNYSKLVT